MNAKQAEENLASFSRGRFVIQNTSAFFLFKAFNFCGKQKHFFKQVIFFKQFRSLLHVIEGGDEFVIFDEELDSILQKHRG